MIENIRHTGIVTDDLEASLKFYRDLLGFTVAKRMEESGAYIDHMSALKNVKVTTVKMTLANGQMIELLKYSSHPVRKEEYGLTRIGTSHIALTVDDLDKEYERFTRAGILFNAPPQFSPDGYAKVTFCRAPEGTLIELVEVLK